jgi:hypothetical protein
MNDSLSRYSQALTSIAARHWPSQQKAAYFEPQLDLSLGDLSSRLPTALARAFQGRPEDFAAQLCEIWQGQGLAPLRSERGFLNVSVCWNPEDDLLPELAPVSAYPSYRVILPPPIEESDRLPTCRLALRALLQTWLMRKHRLSPAFEILGSGPVDLPSGEAAVAAVLDVFQRHPLQKVAEVVSAVETELALGRRGGMPSILWLLPATIPAKEFRRLFPRQEDSGQLRLAYVDAAWSHWPSTEAVCTALLKQAQNYPTDLLYYLGGSVAGSDIDLAVPALAEKANPFRYARMTHERLSRLLASGGVNNSFDLLPVLSTIVHRVRYFGAFEYFAAVTGSVADYAQVFAELSDLVNTYCNQPDFRSRLSSGKASLVELKILTGVFKLLSDIIPTGHSRF